MITGQLGGRNDASDIDDNGMVFFAEKMTL